VALFYCCLTLSLFLLSSLATVKVSEPLAIKLTLFLLSSQLGVNPADWYQRTTVPSSQSIHLADRCLRPPPPRGRFVSFNRGPSLRPHLCVCLWPSLATCPLTRLIVPIAISALPAGVSFPSLRPRLCICLWPSPFPRKLIFCLRQRCLLSGNSRVTHLFIIFSVSVSLIDYHRFLQYVNDSV
jgi:hypothetical protein